MIETLFSLFFKTGIFTVGGGLAAIPIIQEGTLNQNWMSEEQFISAVAISQSAPGSIGVNLATYVGVEQFGFFGGVIAALSLTLPSLIVITLIARFFPRFSNFQLVKGAFSTIRPAVTGLIAAVAFSMTASVFTQSLDQKAAVSILLFILILTTQLKFRFKSLYTIIFGAIVGIIFM